MTKNDHIDWLQMLTSWLTKNDLQIEMIDWAH
jgi:hypothetical protein